jgi:hypothetical protein
MASAYPRCQNREYSLHVLSMRGASRGVRKWDRAKRSSSGDLRWPKRGQLRADLMRRPARVLRKHKPGRLKATARPHYGGLPRAGWTRCRRRRRNSPDGGHTSLASVPGSAVLKPKIAGKSRSVCANCASPSARSAGRRFRGLCSPAFPETRCGTTIKARLSALRRPSWFEGGRLKANLGASAREIAEVWAACEEVATGCLKFESEIHPPSFRGALFARARNP